MATQLDDAGRAPSRRSTRAGAAAAAATHGRWLLPIWGWLVILWLSPPIIVMIVFGFNDSNRQVQHHAGRASPSRGTATCSTSTT